MSNEDKVLIEPQSEEASLEDVRPGWRIRDKRIELGLSIDELAAQSRIAPKKIQLIEDCDFQSVGDVVYVQGYLRTCAKILGLDANLLIDEFRKLRPNETEQITENCEVGNVVSGHSSSRHSTNAKVADWIGFIFSFGPAPWVAALLVFGLLLAYLFKPELSPETDSARPPQEASLRAMAQTNSARSDNKPVLTLEDGEQSSDEVSNTSPVDGASFEGAVLAETPNQENLNDPTRVQAGNAQALVPVEGYSELQVSFTEECWIEVKDKNSQVIFADLKGSGDNLRLFGEAPFSIMLGNARAVTINVDGEPVAVIASPNRKTLRISGIGSPENAL